MEKEAGAHTCTAVTERFDERHLSGGSDRMWRPY